MKAAGLSALALAAIVSASAPLSRSAAPAVCADCVKASMQALAGEAFHGRGCGTADENAAARYLAEALKRSNIPGGLPDGGYLQPVELRTPAYAATPTLELTNGGASLRLTLGKGMLVRNLSGVFEAPLILADGAQPQEVKGRAVILDAPSDPQAVARLAHDGAVLVIAPASERDLANWEQLAAASPGRTKIAGVAGPARQTVGLALVRPEAMAELRAFAGGQASVAARLGPPRVRITYNVVGVLHGAATDADRQAVLLSAHYDHLGVRGGVIFHGANDDASGTAAVLEFARILGDGPVRRRTAWFTLFGCEEEGALGAQAFLARPPMELADLVLNLEFEMIGVDDPQRPGVLMLTGWERTDLGPALAARGARVGPDLYPEQHFFQRSDNYQLALKGVVAQTVSAWPLPPTYHAPSDDLGHVDLAFMDQVIGSLVAPVTWLLDSDFRPAWNPGQKP